MSLIRHMLIFGVFYLHFTQKPTVKRGSIRALRGWILQDKEGEMILDPN